MLNIGEVQSHEEYLEGWNDAVSELVIPLIVDTSVIGVIDLQSSKPFAFDEDDERLMSLFAVRAALMIDHVRLVELTEERIGCRPRCASYHRNFLCIRYWTSALLLQPW